MHCTSIYANACVNHVRGGPEGVDGGGRVVGVPPFPPVQLSQPIKCDGQVTRVGVAGRRRGPVPARLNFNN